jgi:elongation factor Ts
MAITAKDVQALRQATGLGMMECKEALKETDGDVEKAKDLLRQRGLAKMDSRADRDSAEGRVSVAVNEQGTKACVVEINTETDFTAGNEAFKSMVDKIALLGLEQDRGDLEKTDAMQTLIDEVRLTTKENVQFGKGRILGGSDLHVGGYLHFTGKIGVIVELDGAASPELIKDLCMHISAVTPTPQGLTEEEIPAETVEHEKQIAKAQAMEQGKPENIAEKMVEGKIRKYYDDVVLPRQKFIKDEKQQIKDILPKGVTITGFARLAVGG